MSDDHQLLTVYVRDNSRNALDALIRRHLPLVYSAARRQVRDPHLAEDVAQAVFLVLAQKARTIREGTAVGGWLLAVTRHAALNALKQQAIEKRHQTMAGTAKFEGSGVESKEWNDWDRVASVLDEAMNRLPPKDRDAIVLRFFQDQSFSQIGTALAMSDDTAQKRVSRALDKLRRILTRRGITLPATALAATLTARAIEAAPAHLLAQTLAGTAGAATTASATIAKGAITVMTWAKLKIAGALTITALLVTASVAKVVHTALAQPAAPTRPVAATLTAPASAPALASAPAPAIAPGYIIKGIVVDERGNAVTAATIEHRIPGPAVLRATSSPDGTFSMAAPREGDKYNSYTARSADGSQMAWLQMRPAEDGKPATELTLVLRPVRTMPATVLDDKGSPVAAAQITAFADYEPVAEATSDAAGTAAIRFPADAPLVAIAAAKPGTGLDYQLFWPPGAVRNDPYTLDFAKTSRVSFILNGTRQTVLHVTDDLGAPIAGAKIYPWFFQKPRKGGSLNVTYESLYGETDEHGDATYDIVPSDNQGKVDFRVRKTGYAAMDRFPFDPAGTSPAIAVQLLKMRAMTGRVLDSHGLPAGGAIVQVNGAAYSIDNFRASTTSGPDGIFSIDVNPNTYYAITAFKGQDVSEVRHETLLTQAPPRFDLTLAPGQRIYGRVTAGPTNAPVSFADIALLMTDDTYHELPPDQQKLPPLADNRVVHISAIIGQGSKTSADGIYEFFVPLGHYYVWANNGRGLGSENFDVKARDEKEVNLHYTSAVDAPKERPGRVVRADKPDEGVPEVILQTEFLAAEGTKGSPPWGTAGKDGRFTLQSTDKDYFLMAISPDRKWAGLGVIRAGTDPILMPVSPTASVTGRLIDDQGKPLADRTIIWLTDVVSPDGKPGGFASPRGPLGGSTQTDKDGKFAADGLLTGRKYRFHTTKPFAFGTDIPDLLITTITTDKAEPRDLGSLTLQHHAVGTTPASRPAAPQPPSGLP